MSLLQQFIFPVTAEPVRVQLFDSEPWFHLSDLCKILGIKNPSELISQFEDTNKQTIPLASGKPPWFIDEEALYTIVLRCQDALEPGTVAYQFRKWVISVIKNIRKTGTYTATASDQQHFAPFGITLQLKIDECDRYIEAAQPTADIAKVLRNRKALEQAYKAQPKVKPVEAEDELYQPIANLLSGRSTGGDTVILEAVAHAVISGTVTRSHELRVGKILRLLGYEKKRESTGARRRIFVKGT
jgi:prophage antirepressor-like protein